MKTRTVYRVEHEVEGYGPYLKVDEDMDFSPHEDVKGLHDAHEASNSHPGPRMDGLSYERTHRHVHGFDTRSLLDEWFAGFKRKLKSAGFVVRVYEAPAESTFTGESGRQCIFRKDMSRLVDTQSVIAYRSTSRRPS